MAKSGVTYINPPSVAAAGRHVQPRRAHGAGRACVHCGAGRGRCQGHIRSGVGDLAAQVDQVFANLGGILKDLGTDFESVVQFTTYLTKAESIPVWMSARSEVFPKLFPGGKYPPNTLARDRPPGEARVPARDRGDRAGAGVGLSSRACRRDPATRALACVGTLDLRATRPG